MILNLKSGIRGKIALIPWAFLPFLLITCTTNGAEIKIATYNIHHMDRFIDQSPAIAVQMEDKCKAIAANIEAINPDILAIQEAPTTKEQLMFFVQRFLEDKYKVYFKHCRNQSLALLVKKDMEPPCTVHQVARPQYENSWRADVDGDGKVERWWYYFTRPPLEVDLKFDSGSLKIIVLHLEAKYAKSIVPRYRLIAQARRLRELIAPDVDTDIIILGDMGDNPGFRHDPYERGLRIDGIAESIGKPPNEPESSLSHMDERWRFTCIYSSDVTDDPGISWVDRILFTKALNEESITYKKGCGKIHHELPNPLASDHLPVSAVFIVGE